MPSTHLMESGKLLACKGWHFRPWNDGSRNGFCLLLYRTHYIYDVFDGRIAREVDADGDGPQQPVRTQTSYDGENPYIDLDDQGNVQHYYLYGPDIDQVLARLDPVTGIPDWYLTDYIRPGA